MPRAIASSLLAGLVLLAAGFASWTFKARTYPAPLDREYLPAAAPTLPVSGPFGHEQVGTEPTALVALAGQWLVGFDDGRTVLVVDGRGWAEGTVTPTLGAKASRLFGDDGARFTQRLSARADFPLAVLPINGPFENGTITVRFKPVAGREDQALGIVFDLTPDADYWTVRANALEDNLILWRVQAGRRVEMDSKNVVTPSGRWHELRVSLLGTGVEASLDGGPPLRFALPRRTPGRIGLWSKADSVVYISDIRVEASR
jgi:hypothetical protein